VKAVVLLSGGLDSTTLFYKALREVTDTDILAISFDYGQRHRKELDKAQYLTSLQGVPHHIIDLYQFGHLLSGSALSDSSVAVPDGHYAEETMKITIVPNRNTIMLSCAVGVAIGQGYDQVWAAMHAGDHYVYPDCRSEFIDKLNELIPIATETDVQVYAPFINVPKDEIVRIGDSLNVPWDLTWSCYKGGDKHCGRCGTCVERQEAFHLAGVKDPTEYADSEYWKQVTA